MKILYIILTPILFLCAFAQFISSYGEGWDAGRMALGLIFFGAACLGILVIAALFSISD